METLNQWASRQSARRLEVWGIAGEADNDRAFFPRVALGAYFADQLRLMLARPGRHVITLRQRARVTDVMARADGTVLRWHSHGQDHEEVFDRLVIATGYSAPRRKIAVPGASEIRQANKVGVLGSSLSAIDVAVDLARRNGRFQSDGAKLRYAADRNWHVTLLSRSGLLPEADFWFPHPPEPLDLFTDAALARIVSGKDGDLDRAFDLFARQLRALDPAYGEVIGLDQADADSFADRHFARRMASDPFAWAVRDLADARRSHRTKHAEPWRYALLRMHEPFGRIVPLLSKRDLGRFERGLKRCFTDNYAAVPHLSIRRLLAMHEAGVLAVNRLGDSYELTREEQGGASVRQAATCVSTPWPMRVGNRRWACPTFLSPHCGCSFAHMLWLIIGMAMKGCPRTAARMVTVSMPAIRRCRVSIVWPCPSCSNAILSFRGWLKARPWRGPASRSCWSRQITVCRVMILRR
jgi:uncharacterized NAD(P)/FAD-binding protein YdhS